MGRLIGFGLLLETFAYEERGDRIWFYSEILLKLINNVIFACTPDFMGLNASMAAISISGDILRILNLTSRQ